MQTILKFFADLRLTIVLLALSLVMIFFGTLDQTNIGIKGALKKYFEENPSWENPESEQMEKRFHIALWQYPEEWPGGTSMLLALKPDDPNAGSKNVDLKKLQDSGYRFAGYNDNPCYEKARSIYRESGLDGPDLKFGSLKAIKSVIQNQSKVAAVLPSSSVLDDKELGSAKIKGTPSFNFHFIRIPIVCGYILGPMLFLNLLAAHFVRFQLTWKKAGVFTIHIGLILMLLSELVTDLTDRESLMSIEEGETSYYSTDFDKNEIVLLDRSQPKVDTALSIPVSLVEKKKKKDIDVSEFSADFPFQLKILEFFPNTDMDIKEEEGATEGYPFQVGDRTVRVVAKKAKKTFDPQEINFVSALVEVKAGDQTYGPFFISNRLEFFEDHRRHSFEHEGKEFAIALRRTRYYYDFGVRLDDFRFLRYPGTEKAKDFTSDVTLLLPDGSTEPKRIFMNHPLIHDNNTFFQSGWNEKTERGTRLQVVQNPGKLLPYYGVAIVGLGLCIQFGMHLGNFTKRRARQQKKEASA